MNMTRTSTHNQTLGTTLFRFLLGVTILFLSFTTITRYNIPVLYFFKDQAPFLLLAIVFHLIVKRIVTEPDQGEAPTDLGTTHDTVYETFHSAFAFALIQISDILVLFAILNVSLLPFTGLGILQILLLFSFLPIGVRNLIADSNQAKRVIHQSLIVFLIILFSMYSIKMMPLSNDSIYLNSIFESSIGRTALFILLLVIAYKLIVSGLGVCIRSFGKNSFATHLEDAEKDQSLKYTPTQNLIRFTWKLFSRLPSLLFYLLKKMTIFLSAIFPILFNPVVLLLLLLFALGLGVSGTIFALNKFQDFIIGEINSLILPLKGTFIQITSIGRRTFYLSQHEAIPQLLSLLSSLFYYFFYKPYKN